ncbi:serine hydrolase [Amycolatopsis minnesotensis]|uniref:Serine hydrolase n=1 Tax=Amycolatopsis minnesotensis TaxID=337894 RepID=A0ABP5C9C4_9PSEU
MKPSIWRVLAATATAVVLAIATSSTSIGIADWREASRQPSFDKELRKRIAATKAYVAGRPGVAGIVLRDRQTGAVWRSPDAGTLIWACSTPKLAMVVDLLLRNDSGAVRLTPDDRALMHRMLNSSDDDAAHTLWNRYGGEDFAKRFPSYGMTDMRFTDQHPHHWGWILTTANDLDRLVNYVLKMPPRHRDYLVHEMQHVDPNQQWGVWGAGPAAAPGNKNGWSDDNDDGSWITNSVGFTGPGQRYTLAIMDNTKVIQQGFETGKETTTGIGRTLFDGYFR